VFKRINEILLKSIYDATLPQKGGPDLLVAAFCNPL